MIQSLVVRSWLTALFTLGWPVVYVRRRWFAAVCGGFLFEWLCGGRGRGGGLCFGGTFCCLQEEPLSKAHV